MARTYEESDDESQTLPPTNDLERMVTTGLLTIDQAESMMPTTHTDKVSHVVSSGRSDGTERVMQEALQTLKQLSLVGLVGLTLNPNPNTRIIPGGV